MKHHAEAGSERSIAFPGEDGVSGEDAAELLDTSFGSELLGGGSSDEGCAVDPEAAVLEGQPQAMALLLTERMLQTLVVAAGATIAPELGGLAASTDAVFKGLARHMVRRNITSSNAPLVDLGSVSTVLAVLEEALVNLQLEPELSNLALLPVAIVIADHLQLIREMANDPGAGTQGRRLKQATGARLLEATGITAIAVQECWLEQAHNNKLSYAMSHGESSLDLAIALAPLSRSVVQKRMRELSVPDYVWTSSEGLPPRPLVSQTPAPTVTATPSVLETATPTSAPGPTSIATSIPGTSPEG